MTLSPALTVALAVDRGVPADVRSWVSVDLAEYFTAGRRGFLIATESLNATSDGEELARQTRAVIMAELRRQYLLPAERALGRAFAAGNAFVLEQLRDAIVPDGSYPDRVGVTAVVIDGHIATIGFVPPGQAILIEDGLVYAVPPIESWYTDFADPNSDDPPPEPLGFGTRVAPVIAQTDLRAGDTIILCSTSMSRAFADEMDAAGVSSSGLAFLHGRDPDKILDVFRDLIVNEEIARGAVTVLGFAPRASGTQVRTLGDVGRRAKDTWRRTKSELGRVRPHRETTPEIPPEVAPMAVTVAPEDDPLALPDVDRDATSTATSPSRRAALRTRSLQLAERLVERRQTTWEPPTHIRQFGVPGAHGVQGYRGLASETGEEGWRNRLPRIPVPGPVVWAFFCLLLIAVIVGGAFARERWFSSEQDYHDDLTAVDRSIVEARSLTDEDEIDDAYQQAQRDLELAEASGAPKDAVEPRQQAITSGLDEIHDVIRMDGVTRIGGLPSDLQSGTTRVVRTPGGIFLVSGSLYLLQADQKQIDKVVDSGTEIVAGSQVGNLYGIAYDATGLYITDGAYVYVYTSADNEWRAVKLGEINNQGPWPAGSVGTFDGNLYILEAEYRNIYQFNTELEAGSTTADAIDWVATSARLNLDDAVDMAIDGNIYVLLNDGTVVKYRQGNIDATDPIVMTEHLTLADGESVKSIVTGPATGYLYVAITDGKNGRIVAFNPTTGDGYQLELPAGFSTDGVGVKAPFQDLQTIAIDEDAGTVYIVNGDAIWSARYSLPSDATPGTPVATPDSEGS